MSVGESVWRLEKASNRCVNAAARVEAEPESEEERLRRMLEVTPHEPRWGTPEARLREMARLQLRINEQRRRKKEG